MNCQAIFNIDANKVVKLIGFVKISKRTKQNTVSDACRKRCSAVNCYDYVRERYHLLHRTKEESP